MRYFLDFTDEAEKGMSKLKRNEKFAYIKLEKLLLELSEHPKIGTGKPEQLSGNRSGQWSRRITDKHRLVYEIFDNRVLVLVVSTYGHYGDK